ncbi:MAG: hypothetical protein HY438_02380 [DPANN group archaeon]|nr:hypothetical protein [DPANN group archaeon]
MAKLTDDVSVYMYMPSREPDSTRMTTYRLSSQAQDNTAWAERFASDEIKKASPHSNPFSVQHFESMTAIIYKYVAKDSYGRDAKCANILLAGNNTFATRGLSYPRLFLAVKDPSMLKRLDTHELISLSEDNLKSYLGGGANEHFYWHLLSAAGLLDKNGFLEIRFNPAERYAKLVPFLASVFSMTPHNNQLLPYTEYNTDNGCIAQVGSLEKKLSNTLLGGPPEIDLNSANAPNIRSEFYETLLDGMQKHILADTALRSISQGHKLANHFGRDKLTKFIKDYSDIRIDFYTAIDTAVKTGLFSGDTAQATKKCYELAEFIGQEQFISFVHNHGTYGSGYGVLVRGTGKLLFKDTQLATYAYHKLAAFFGESKIEEFLGNRN